MLDEKIKNSDLMEDLHYEDCVILTAAQTLMKSAPIGNFIKGDGSDKVWFEKNLNTQQSLLGLKSRIDYLASQYQIQFHKMEGNCLSSGEYEFIKARDERISIMIAKEPEVADIKISLEKLRVMSKYIDGLIWSLRDLMRLFK